MVEKSHILEESEGPNYKARAEEQLEARIVEFEALGVIEKDMIPAKRASQIFAAALGLGIAAKNRGEMELGREFIALANLYGSRAGVEEISSTFRNMANSLIREMRNSVRNQK